MQGHIKFVLPSDKLQMRHINNVMQDDKWLHESPLRIVVFSIKLVGLLLFL